MTYDLRHERWIPWRRRSGTVEWGPPWLLTDGIAGDDPIVALAAPRPDFDGALQEFLIGLLGVALQVADEEAWEALWRSPPSPEALRAALDRLPQAFDLDGEGRVAFRPSRRTILRRRRRWASKSFWSIPRPARSSSRAAASSE